MPDFITLACPSCGARLEITNDLDRFACSHCGQEHIVRRAGGVVSLSPVIGAINRVQKGVDRTAAELALQRLPREIAVLLAEHNKISFEYPFPDIGAWPWISLIFGAILVIIGLILGLLFLIVKSSQTFIGAFVLLGFGLLGAAYGAFVIFYLFPRNKHNWEQQVQPRLKYVNDQIVKKQSQIKYNQNLLAN